MSEQPAVTVLMSAFNGAAFLSEAVESILRQTFRNFEFLIIDDASTDGSAKILAAVRDPRVRVVRNDTHLGLTRSLRLGIELARGQYVARMDADDLALPERLEKQVAYLTMCPDVGIVGSACCVIDQSGCEVGLLRMPEDDLQIRWASLMVNPFAHPTVMLRRDVLIREHLNYDETFHTTQDYELWTRVLSVTRGANLREPLVQYRTHGARVTSTRREVQLRNHDTVALRTIRAQLPEFAITSEQVRHLRGLFVGGGEAMPELDARRVALAETYLDMLDAFMAHHARGPAVQTLRRQEAVKVSRLIVRFPLQPGWRHVAKRLIAMDRLLPWSLSAEVWKAACGRLRRRVFKSSPADGGFSPSRDARVQ
jgi:hypothetical protein